MLGQEDPMSESGPVEVSECELVSASGETIHVADPERLVHMQFRRYDGVLAKKYGEHPDDQWSV